MHGLWVKPINFDVKPGTPITLEGPSDALTFLRMKWQWPITDEWIYAMSAFEACMDHETDTAEPSYAPVKRALEAAGLKVT